MAKNAKKEVEILLVKAKLDALPERKLVKSRNLVCVDLVWPRASIARKSSAREVVFRKGNADFTGEPWAKRTMLREEINAHSAIAVSITEPMTIQKIKRFARLTAKYALRMGRISWRRRWSVMPILHLRRWMRFLQWSARKMRPRL